MCSRRRTSCGLHKEDGNRERASVMNEDIRKQVAALNGAWRRYGRAVEQHIDTIPMDALNHDYLAALEGLAAFGIAEHELVYDPATMTFSLPTTGDLMSDG